MFLPAAAERFSVSGLWPLLCDQWSIPTTWASACGKTWPRRSRSGRSRVFVRPSQQLLTTSIFVSVFVSVPPDAIRAADRVGLLRVHVQGGHSNQSWNLRCVACDSLCPLCPSEPLRANNLRRLRRSAASDAQARGAFHCLFACDVWSLYRIVFRTRKLRRTTACTKAAALRLSHCTTSTVWMDTPRYSERITAC